MKHFFKTLLITTLLLGAFQSCTSDETVTETISDEKISSSLLDIMYVTAETKSDYNLINFDCENLEVGGGFLNNQGDYYGGVYIETSSWNDELMSDALEQAYLYTNIRFTKDDFSILYITPSIFFGEVYFNKNDIIAYFEDCSFEGDTKTTPEFESVKVSDVNFNCSGTMTYYIDGLTNSPSFNLPLEEGIEAVEQALSLYNDTNSTEYVLDDLRSSYIAFTSPGGTLSYAYGKTQMMNYFEDCILDKDYNDCINFKYPFVINKIDLQTDDIIPVTVTSDADLFQQNFTDVNITIDYPITLVTLIGSEFIVNSNTELEDALTNSADYCIDEW